DGSPAARGRHRPRGGRRPAAPPRQGRRAGQAPRPRAHRPPPGPGLVRRGRAPGQLGAGRPGRRRRRHRHGPRRRPPRRGHGQRPDGEGRVLGAEDRREDPAHPGARGERAGADDLPRRLGGRADHRAGADVPRPPRGGADLRQRGAAQRRRAAAVRVVRAERRGRRVHPRVLRRGDHARRQRVDVPRLPADGRDGHRGEGHARGDGRRADAHGRLGLRAPARQDGRGGRGRRPALPELPAVQLGRGAARGAAGRAGQRLSHPRPDPRGREQAVRHQGAHRVAGRRRVVLRDPRALGQGARGGLRAPRGPRHRDRGQPAQAEGRRPVRRLGRQGRALHLDVQRVQRPAALPGRRARLHDRDGGRAPGHHPPRRQDDLRGDRGDGPQAQRDRPQGLRRRALRDGGAGVRPRRLPGAARRVDRRDGPAGGGERGLLQPAPGHRGPGRAGRPPGGAAPGVRRGHRPPAPGLRARGGRRDPARGPAGRADAPLRAGRGQGARLAGQAQPDHAGL
ncbi:MAG: Methylcrotonyl-CoA carboxylase carboxyl transferase subunit, partial [uncultured Solirubrobacteraceae bacterium]